MSTAVGTQNDRTVISSWQSCLAFVWYTSWDVPERCETTLAATSSVACIKFSPFVCKWYGLWRMDRCGIRVLISLNRTQLTNPKSRKINRTVAWKDRQLNLHVSPFSYILCMFSVPLKCCWFGSILHAIGTERMPVTKSELWRIDSPCAMTNRATIQRTFPKMSFNKQYT